MNTKQQWAIGIDSDAERVQIITQDGQHLCYVEQDPVMEYAHLIAAAPEMYEVLRDILWGAIPLSSNSTMEFGKCYIGVFKVYGNRLGSAAQALAKAEGKEEK